MEISRTELSNLFHAILNLFGWECSSHPNTVLTSKELALTIKQWGTHPTIEKVRHNLPDSIVAGYKDRPQQEIHDLLARFGVRLIRYKKRGVNNKHPHMEYALPDLDFGEYPFSGFVDAWLNSNTPTGHLSTKNRAVKGYVYCVCQPQHKLYKIGVAKDVNKRLRHGQCFNPFDLVVVHTIYTTDSYGLEVELHERFQDKRIRGEWFELTPEDIEYIKTLQHLF